MRLLEPISIEEAQGIISGDTETAAIIPRLVGAVKRDVTSYRGLQNLDGSSGLSLK
jgi:hypothetical protein